MTKFTVNGQPIEYHLDPETPLLWALRDSSNLTGTKYGCGTGDCGVCGVDIDGRLVNACQIAIKSIEGAFVTTIEGLSNEHSHPVQLAWLAERVTQCGYCDPGMIMAAAVLLKNNKAPTDAEIDAAIPNLCRCGVYPRVRRAVQNAAKMMGGGAPSGGAELPHTEPASMATGNVAQSASAVNPQ